jgi:hypothetical protein
MKNTIVKPVVSVMPVKDIFGNEKIPPPDLRP